MTGGPPRPYGADAELAESGARRISYSERSMPLLQALAHRFGVERPFDGMTVAACLHVTAETAVLARVLVAGGARVALAASNPLSTQDPSQHRRLRRDMQASRDGHPVERPLNTEAMSERLQERHRPFGIADTPSPRLRELGIGGVVARRAAAHLSALLFCWHKPAGPTQYL